jgi:hypothetical protein
MTTKQEITPQDLKILTEYMGDLKAVLDKKLDIIMLPHNDDKVEELSIKITAIVQEIIKTRKLLKSK